MVLGYKSESCVDLFPRHLREVSSELCILDPQAARLVIGRPWTISILLYFTGQKSGVDTIPCDKSLNLTAGSLSGVILEPAAMNWKTERNHRLNDQVSDLDAVRLW